MKRNSREWYLIAMMLVMASVLACIGTGDDATPTEELAGAAATEGAEVGPTGEGPGEETQASPTAEGPVEEPSSTPAGCTLDASYVADINVPDDTVFAPNTPFVKTWRIQNSGTCDWETGTQLVYVSDHPLGGPTGVDIPPTAAGANVDVSVNFVSPGSPGTYRSNWQVRIADGSQFGDVIYVQIVVPEPTPQATATSPPPTATSVPPTATPHPPAQWGLYSMGDQGPVVFAIQYLLRAEGYSLTVDGTYGPQTRSSVMSFQSAHGLTADGIVGPATWPVLVSDHTVGNGSSGDAVRAVQYLLANKFGYNITVDGIFGRGTSSAVQDFQSSHGLTVDSIVGQNTWRELQGN